jgi:hypothetical protein
MQHKDSNNGTTEVRVLTPEEVQEALENLPFNYVLLAKDLLKERFEAGLIPKAFEKRYITKVRKSEGGAFNADVMDAVVEIGRRNLEKKRLYGVGEQKSETNSN